MQSRKIAPKWRVRFTCQRMRSMRHRVSCAGAWGAYGAWRESARSWEAEECSDEAHRWGEVTRDGKSNLKKPRSSLQLIHECKPLARDGANSKTEGDKAMDRVTKEEFQRCRWVEQKSRIARPKMACGLHLTRGDARGRWRRLEGMVRI